MQEADMKGYVHPRKELDAVESYSIYQGSEKIRYVFRKILLVAVQ